MLVIGDQKDIVILNQESFAVIENISDPLDIRRPRLFAFAFEQGANFSIIASVNPH